MKKSNIEWADHTLNLLTGCMYDCPNCSARITALSYGGDQRRNLVEKDKYHIEGDIIVTEEPLRAVSGHVKPYPFGFMPTYHRYNLGNVLEKMRMGQNVYVGAMGEMFGPWVPDEIIEEIFEECKKYPRNNYLFLTHNPERYRDLAKAGKLPELDNFWYGSSIASSESPWWYSDRHHFFVNVEPLKEEIPEFARNDGCFPEWIIIGAETGKHKAKVVPDLEWIQKIVEEADCKSAPVFMKDSLLSVVGEKDMKRDFPDKLQGKKMSPKMIERLYSNCCVCRGEYRKNQMITLLAKYKRGEQAKQYGFMCKQCFEKHCENLGADIPELKKSK